MLPDVVGAPTCQVISIFAITSTGGYILCRLSGNFWRILSNPPFLLIKGNQIVLTFPSNYVFFKYRCSTVDLFKYPLWPSDCCLRKWGAKIGRRKLDLENLLCSRCFSKAIVFLFSLSTNTQSEITTLPNEVLQSV